MAAATTIGPEHRCWAGPRGRPTLPRKAPQSASMRRALSVGGVMAASRLPPSSVYPTLGQEEWLANHAGDKHTRPTFLQSHPQVASPNH